MFRIARALRSVCLIGIFVALSIHPSLAAEKGKATTKIPQETLTGKLRKHNPEFFISVDSVLLKLKQKREIALVDVRDRSDFERFRIPGSINVPLFALKTKTFLKSKPFLLINEGHSYTQLETECKRLRALGFSQASIMYGGLAAWIQRNGPLEGDVFSRKELNQISPRDLFAERDYANWLMVDVSEAVNADTASLIPRTVSVPYHGDSASFIAALENSTRHYGTDPFLSVLIFNQNGKYSQEMEGFIQKAKVDNVFYLEGGLEGYREFLRDQALLRQTKESRKVVKKCVNCP